MSVLCLTLLYYCDNVKCFTFITVLMRRTFENIALFFQTDLTTNLHFSMFKMYVYFAVCRYVCPLACMCVCFCVGIVVGQSYY